MFSIRIVAIFLICFPLDSSTTVWPWGAKVRAQKISEKLQLRLQSPNSTLADIEELFAPDFVHTRCFLAYNRAQFVSLLLLCNKYIQYKQTVLDAQYNDDLGSSLNFIANVTRFYESQQEVVHFVMNGSVIVRGEKLDCRRGV